jgi:small-conductance mechanosensitive channel
MMEKWNIAVPSQSLWTFFKVVLLLGVGLPLLKLLSNLSVRILRRRFSPQSQMIVQKTIYYLGLFLLLVTLLNQVGLKLSALLGAAGIVGIALGFASQTSVSNIVSGVFLIWEEPFQIGDVIKVGDTTGTIISIDLLSIKLRTFANQFIRIPNEHLIKTQVVNYTHFPIRRLDFEVGVAYREDIRRVIDVLRDLADKHPLSLDEPEPLVFFREFGDSSLLVQFGVWVTREDYFELKKEMMILIKERFEAEGIEIPFPHRSLYAGSRTDPFPVRLVDERQEDSPGKEPSAPQQ